MSTAKIGFIGLGRMGKPMAANLRRKQFSLSVYDVRREPMVELESLGATAASSARELMAASDIVVTMVPSEKEVEELVSGPGGLAEVGKRGALLLDMSTIDPFATDRIAAALAAKGMTMVDAPVGRLAQHADRGESLFMVGGSDTDFHKIKPLLDAMGTTVYHCGPVGTGIRTKLVNNFLAVSLCQMNAEALGLAQRLGLSLPTTLDVLYGTTATNGQLKINWPDKVLKGDTQPGFTIDLAHKDLSLIVNTANQAKVPMPMAAAAREAFSTARALGLGNQDFSAMLVAICRLMDIDSPRLP